MRMETLDHRVTLCFTIWELPDHVPKQRSHVRTPPAVHEGSSFSTVSPTLALIYIFYYSPAGGVQRYLMVVWICISLVASNTEHLFMGVLAICQHCCKHVSALILCTTTTLTDKYDYYHVS